MGLFSVWVKVEWNNYQRLITFVNREAADEWWRTISTPPSAHVGCFKRISPQFYVQIDGKDLRYSLDVGTLSGPRYFYERLFFACTIKNPDMEPTTVTLSNEVTDHISGQWYFIRSKADAFSHWYLCTSGPCAVCEDANCNAIHVSSNYRTRFCVRVRDSAAQEDFVMIGKDEISIAAPKGYVLYIDDDVGELKAMKGYQGETDILFGDFGNRFLTRAERQVNGEVWEYVESVERGVGEIWELVK